MAGAQQPGAKMLQSKKVVRKLYKTGKLKTRQSEIFSMYYKKSLTISISYNIQVTYEHTLNAKQNQTTRCNEYFISMKYLLLNNIGVQYI